MRRTSQDRALVRELQASHRTSVLTLCAMLLVSLASSGYLLLVSQPAVSRYTDLVRDARLMHEAMVDQETGLRGWLATGSPGFLQPTLRGARVEEELSQTLLERSAEDQGLTAALVPTLMAQRDWDDWADRAARWQSGPGEHTRNELLTFLYQGKAFFDVYREADARSTSYVVAQRDRAIARERVALIASLVVSLTMLAAAAAHTLQRRRRLHRAVLDPITQLADTIRSLRSGDLSARSASTGVTELDTVSTALNGFADELSEARELAASREARLSLLARRLETVITVTRETAGSVSVRYVSESVVGAAADLLGAPTRLWVRDEEGLFRAVRCSQDPHGVVPPPDLQAPAFVAAVAAEARPQDNGEHRAFPLILAGSVVGVLQVGSATVDPDAEHVLNALLSTAAAGLESARLHSSAREQADMDALTHLPNRRRLDSDLQLEWQRSRRYDRPLTFLMLDLDHFKSLNDTYGHVVGDMVLRESATAVAASLRETDTAYRYGGEELAVLLRETTLEEALHVAERLRSAVAAVTVPGHPVTVTTSVGVAQAMPGMSDHSALVTAADSALYLAKNSGRNRVEFVGEAPGADRGADRRTALEVAS